MELKETFQKVKAASKTLGLLTDEQRNEILQAVADAIIAETPALLKANAEDLAKMDKANPLYDRLQLTEQRLQDIASDMRHVSTLPSPLGRVLKDKTLENGLHLQRVAVPFGVIGMIYEARPNVTYDVFSLCFKSGNACVLKGGKDANASNSAGVELIHRVLITFGIDPNVVTLLPATHEATGEMLNAVGYIDLCIPRGGKKLINFVRDTAKVPVIETGAGVVHCYFDKDGDLEMGKRIITKSEFLGNVIKLCIDKRGVMKNQTFITQDRVEVNFDMPLSEIVFDFYDKLKSISKGYASFDYHRTGFQPSKLVKLDILLNGEPVDALSSLTYTDHAYDFGRKMCEKLKELIPRQQFDIAIQAAVGAKIIARETVKAVRKDVTAKCYGGDISRKRKLLEKQKKGKKRMRQIGNVEVPQSAFLAVLKMD